MMDEAKLEALYQESLKVVDAVIHDNGATTASLPGSRYEKWVYPRDHNIVVMGMISAAEAAEGSERERWLEQAKKGLEFMIGAQFEDGSFPQRYNVDGTDASNKPKQIDGNGLFLNGVARYLDASQDSEFGNENWREIEAAAKHIVRQIHDFYGLVAGVNGIHELPPIEEGIEVWSNAVCISGIRRVAKVARQLGYSAKGQIFNETADGMEVKVDQYLWNEQKGSYVKVIRLGHSSSVETRAFADTYALADYGVLDDASERVQRNVARVEKQLWHPELGGLCRYEESVGRNNAGWGPWAHFTLMVARHHITNGNKEQADKYLGWIVDIAHKNQLPEHIATKEAFETAFAEYEQAGLFEARPDRKVMNENARKQEHRPGVIYAVLPLAWPHAEFIRTYNLYKETFRPQSSESHS
jgi:GH15 family glucan-1,4-alpha-glucosidase